MNKQQLIETIRAIEPEFNGKGTVQLLNLKLQALQPDMDKAAEDREQRQSVAATMESANKTVPTNGSKFATIRGEIINDMETGEIVRGRVKANVWQLVVADLKVKSGKVDGKSVHSITADLSPRQVMTRSASPVPVKGEFHDTFVAIQLDAMRDQITETAMRIYTEAQRKERTAWIRQKESTFNTALRNACAEHDLDTVSMASAGTGDAKESYFKVVAQKEQIAEKDKTKKQKKTEAKAKLDTITDSDKVLDNVALIEALRTVALAYVKSGRESYNSAMVAFDKLHAEMKSAQTKEAARADKKAA